MVDPQSQNITAAFAVKAKSGQMVCRSQGLIEMVSAVLSIKHGLHVMSMVILAKARTR